METKFKAHAYRSSFQDIPFQGTATFSANDFINPKTQTHYAYPQLPPDKSIYYINGIDNTFDDFQGSLLHLAEISNYNIEGIFCPTLGVGLDSNCYLRSLRGGFAYEGTRELQKNIRNFDAKSSPNATMMVIPHSRGAVYTRNGLIDSPEHLRDRVDVRAFAPGGYIDSSLCKSVVHYVSPNDIVPKLDRSGRERCKDTIITLNRHADASWMDHTFTSPTYVESLEAEIKDYLRR